MYVKLDDSDDLIIGNGLIRLIQVELGDTKLINSRNQGCTSWAKAAYNTWNYITQSQSLFLYEPFSDLVSHVKK